jgi:hypothetical protein
MTYRIKPQDLTPTNSSPFMSTHGARIQAPLDAALADAGLFMTVRSNLRPGDEVTVCRYGAGDWTKARILERAKVLILQSTVKAVEFEVIEPVRVLGAAKPELEVIKPEPKPAELEIVPDPNGGFIVRDAATGNVHKHFGAKAAATRYVNDYGKQKAA